MNHEKIKFFQKSSMIKLIISSANYECVSSIFEIKEKKPDEKIKKLIENTKER